MGESHHWEMRRTLILSCTYRCGQQHARTLGIPWSACLYVASADTIRQLGHGTRGMLRHEWACYRERRDHRTITDALATADLWDAP